MAPAAPNDAQPARWGSGHRRIGDGRVDDVGVGRIVDGELAVRADDEPAVVDRGLAVRGPHLATEGEKGRVDGGVGGGAGADRLLEVAVGGDPLGDLADRLERELAEAAVGQILGPAGLVVALAPTGAGRARREGWVRPCVRNRGFR